MIIIISTIILTIVILCFILDKLFIRIPNVLSSVLYPDSLRRIQVFPDCPPVDSNVVYLPPTTTNVTSQTPVYVIISGNPGVATFYIDYLYQIADLLHGNVHGYAVGHAYHSPIINSNAIQALATKQLKSKQSSKFPIASRDELIAKSSLPRFDSQRLPNIPQTNHKNDDLDPSGPLFVPTQNPEAPWDLHQQIAQKIAVIAKIRTLHPENPIVLAGHSMGAYCGLEVLRAMDRGYILQHWGRLGLEIWDQWQHKLQLKDVENEQIPIIVDESAPVVVRTLPKIVSRFVYNVKQLELWINAGLLLNTQTPASNLVFTIDKQVSSLDTIDLTQLSKMEPFDLHELVRDSIPEELAQKIVTEIETNLAPATSYIVQMHGLMPTIVRIGNTPNGHQMTPWFQRRHILRQGIRLLSRFPGPVKRVLSCFAALPWRHPDVYTSIQLFLNEEGIQGCVDLATAEMNQIRGLDLWHIQRHCQQLWLTMSPLDEWAPIYQYDYFQNINHYWKQSQLPYFLPITLETTGVTHAFVFGGNRRIAELSIAQLRKSGKLTTAATAAAAAAAAAAHQANISALAAAETK